MPTALRSRSEKVAADLLAQIRRGELAPGDRLPSFPDMKSRGFSQHTMEKAYALLERDGLIERSNGSGIYVAQPEARRKQGAIGFFCPGARDRKERHPYWAQLAQGALHEAECDELDIVLISAELETVRWEKLDGLLIAGGDGQSVKKQAPAGFPLVSLLDPQDEMPSLVIDDYQGQRTLTEHLINLGHQRIALLHSSVGGTVQARLDGYNDALTAAGIAIEPGWVRSLIYPLPEGRFARAGRQGMTDWLESDWRELGCTAILCQNDDTALGVLDVLRAAEIDVPGEVSVAGFDGTLLAEYSIPPLTTMHVPLDEIGAQGVRMLMRYLSGTPMATRNMPISLQLGGTTAPARTRPIVERRRI